MSKLLQLRNVPSALHREIKSIAAREGRTMSEVGIEALEIVARQKKLRKAFRELRNYPPIETKLSTAELVRRERDSR
jgi:hypothetical protein